nr:H-NS histone family protein [Achromobacter kerstersii]
MEGELNNQIFLKPIDAKIQRLQRRMDALHTERQLILLESLVNVMHEHGLSIEALSTAFVAFSGNRRPLQRTALREGRRRPVPPKYRHPTSGETWSGRGKTPRWLASEEANGVCRDQFLIR